MRLLPPLLERLVALDRYEKQRSSVVARDEKRYLFLRYAGPLLVSTVKHIAEYRLPQTWKGRASARSRRSVGRRRIWMAARWASAMV
jgi:hypothetical protein